jgi:hypothetical protein
MSLSVSRSLASRLSRVSAPVRTFSAAAASGFGNGDDDSSKDGNGNVDGISPTPRRFPKPLRTPQFGVDILHDPLWNKGTAFNSYERDRLGLRGLLPPAFRDINAQKVSHERQIVRCVFRHLCLSLSQARVLKHLDQETTNERKNLYLQDLQSRNETLYFRTLVDHIDVMAPLGELLGSTFIVHIQVMFICFACSIHANSGCRVRTVR